MKYQPISCSMYDRLEALSITNKKIQLIFKADDSIENTADGTIADLFSRDGVEYLKINNLEVRLDNIISIIKK